jgi:hypothetical protein
MLHADDAVMVTYTSAVFGVVASGFSDCVPAPAARRTDESTDPLFGQS